MNKQVVESLKKGFALTNRSWDIFLFSLAFSLPFYFSNSLGASPIKSTLEVLGFLLMLIGIAYSMSIPIFLARKQQGKSLHPSELLSITLQSTKRLIIPSILFSILLFLLVVIIGILIAISMNAIGYSMKGFFDNVSKASAEWNLWVMLFGSIFSLFNFASIYFSLEKNGLFSSIKKSVSFSLEHLNFLIVLIFISWINYSLVTFAHQILSEQIHLAIQTVLYAYEGILLTAISLIFYQSVVKKV